MPDAPAPAPGDAIGRYVVLAALGEGGMGAVYEAARADLPLKVALKTMHPALRARDEAVKRFLREAEALARMRHPHVVDVVDFGVDAAHGPWLAMRLLDGESLARRLERGGAMAPAECLAWALPVLAGLRHAHGLGVVHRDLKPDNVFLARTADGHDLPVVIDFGAARYDDGAQPLTASGVMIGTPFYMAPEQFWGSRLATPRSDQYALAFVLYECLAGATPFAADSLVEVIQRAQAGGFEALAARAPTVPAGLSDAVMRALSVDPSQRFDDLAAFARAVLPHAAPTDRARWSAAFGAADAPAATAPPPAAVATAAGPPRDAPPTLDAPVVATPARSWPWVAAAVALALGALAWRVSSRAEAPPRPPAAPSASAPALARAPMPVAPMPVAPVTAPAPPAVDASIARVAAHPRVVRPRPAHAVEAPAPVAPAASPVVAPPVVEAPAGPRGANGAPIRY